jgi:hypothetical protein
MTFVKNSRAVSNVVNTAMGGIVKQFGDRRAVWDSLKASVPRGLVSLV